MHGKWSPHGVHLIVDVDDILCMHVCNISDSESQTDSHYRTLHFFIFFCLFSPLRELNDEICKSEVDFEVHLRHTFPITISTLSFADKVFLGLFPHHLHSLTYIVSVLEYRG